MCWNSDPNSYKSLLISFDSISISLLLHSTYVKKYLNLSSVYLYCNPQKTTPLEICDEEEAAYIKVRAGETAKMALCGEIDKNN